MQVLAQRYRQATKIRVVQDNLNTHTTASFYKVLPAEQAFRLAQRFEFYYTPKSASWLNMIEIEFSALSQQCLNRRIAKQEQLPEEIKAIVEKRNDKAIKINWQFGLEKARSKRNRHYQRVNPENEKYHKT